MKKVKKKLYDIEKGFISKLLESKDMKLIKDIQIKSSFFTGENKRVFLYIQKTFKETREIPTPRSVEQKFPNYQLETHLVNDVETVGTDENLRYWCKELRTKAKHNKLIEVTEKLVDSLDKGNTDEAYAEMKKGVWQIEDEIIETTSVDITKNTEERKQAYLEKKKNKGMIGIPTGIPQLDYFLKGLVDGTLTTIIALTGVGKTWLLVLIACYAQLNGYRVAFFITEMSTDLMRDRCEAMLYGMMYGDFSYSKFKSGALDEETEAQYFEFLEEDLPKLEPMILENVTGISSIMAVVETKNPDLILVDGAYLMEDEQGAKDDWAKITHITRDLKKTAKNINKPVVINTQADQKTTKKTGPALGDIKYSQAIGQDSDNVLSLYRDEIMINDKEMGIRILKNREGVLGKAFINWNFDVMNFKGIYLEKEGGDYSTDDETNMGNTVSIED